MRLPNLQGALYASHDLAVCELAFMLGESIVGCNMWVTSFQMQTRPHIIEETFLLVHAELEKYYADNKGADTSSFRPW